MLAKGLGLNCDIGGDVVVCCRMLLNEESLFVTFGNWHQ